MGGVTVAKHLERLVRFVPGVSGYQDRENARATDKQVRMRLVGELRRLIQSLEDDKERIAASGDLSSLPRLDRLAGRLERLGRTVEFAGRGYSGLFDLHTVDGDTLAQLYAFDLGLFDALSAVRAKAEAVRAALARRGGAPERDRAHARGAGRLRGALRPAPAHRRRGLGPTNAMSPIMMEVIEWFDQTGTGIVQRYPEGGSGDIKMGAQLIVRENQAAVFFRDGQGLDVLRARPPHPVHPEPPDPDPAALATVGLPEPLPRRGLLRQPEGLHQHALGHARSGGLQG